ncbi:AsmA family protein [Pseudodesulfovibrio senegalensis]|uniref:AsmA family protein n=1 Tax=Pseudodesulfovibrio senegalensis TaxID=1721087 RepID=A0A6N6N5A4_9BACT|nr:AsmA family protein [Pseudodesulfovibrio senegalensis]KAB1443362.1 AsmA family protein [Pseudodesulfovibrio senegalensis]
MAFRSRWVVITAGLVVGFLVLAAVLAFTFIRPRQLADLAVAQVRSQTGRDLDFGGELSLSVFPWLGVEASNVTLGNAPGFGPEPMMNVAQVEVRVRLLPLLHGDMEVGHVVLEGVDLNLARNANGVTNWADLVARASQEKSGTSSSQPSSAKSGSDGVKASPGKQTSLLVQEVTMRGVNLKWDDRKQGKQYHLRDGSLELEGFRLNQPFDFTSSFSFVLNDPELEGSVRFAASARLDLERKLYSLINVDSQIGAKGPGVPGKSLEADLRAQGIVVDLKGNTLKAEKLALDAYDVNARADLAVTRLNADPVITGTVSLSEFDGRKLMETLGIVSLQTADASALSSLAGNFDFRFDSKTLAVSRFAMNLDGSTVGGSFGIRNFPNPAYDFELAVDELNVDRYLPLETNSGTRKAESGETVPSGNGTNAATVQKKKSEELYPVDVLRGLDIRGRAVVDRLTVKNLKFSGVKVKLVAENNRISIDPLLLNGYEGNADAVVVVDVAGNTPRTDLVAEVKHLQLGPLLKDYNGEDSLQGKTSLYAALGGDGNTLSALKKTVDGKLSFKLQDGVFPGVNALDLAKSTQNSKEKTGTIESDDDDKTKFGTISGSAAVKDGLVSNRDLTVMAPNLRGKGEGTVNLVSSKIDYLVHVKLVASSKGQGGASYADTPGIPVPIHVGGTLEDPSYFVNPAEYIKMLGSGVADTVGGVVKGAGSVVKGVGEGVGGLIKSIIPNKKKSAQ